MEAGRGVEEAFEEIFGKIKDLRFEAVERKGHQNGCKRESRNHLRPLKSENLVDVALHKTRKTGPKSLLKESKLKVPVKMLPEISKKRTIKRTSVTDKEPEKSLEESGGSNIKGKTIHRSCSMEFRNGSACSPEDYYDTESSDLADYLEQVLSLPKPMSAMAEMMYG
eukprot:gene7629-13445_t